MADGLLSSALGFIDRQKQAAKAGIGLLASNPQEWLTQTTARYLPTRAEEQQYRAVQQAGGDITQTPYYQKLFDLAQFQSSIKTPKVASGLQEFLESSVEKNRLYHGTDKDISEFKRSSRGATFLSPDPDFANRYAGSEYTVDVGGAPNILPVYAQVKKPFDPQNSEHVEKVYDFVNKYQKGAVTKESLKEGEFGTIESYPVQQAIKRLGFDSFYVMEDGVKNIGIFDPKKIKSAIGNRGTYDVTNPNILAAGVPVGLLGSTQVELPKKQEKKPTKK